MSARSSASALAPVWLPAQRLLKPLAISGRGIGVKVLIGTRRGADNELLDALGPNKRVIDLDAPEYLKREDPVDYVRRRLLREDRSGDRTPYRRSKEELVAQVADAVASRAYPSFLVAQLVSSSLADAAEVVDTRQRGWEQQFAGDVGSAMDDYLDRFESNSRASATVVIERSPKQPHFGCNPEGRSNRGSDARFRPCTGVTTSRGTGDTR